MSCGMIVLLSPRVMGAAAAVYHDEHMTCARGSRKLNGFCRGSPPRIKVPNESSSRRGQAARGSPENVSLPGAGWRRSPGLSCPGSLT
jgi:hypothetical protein